MFQALLGGFSLVLAVVFALVGSGDGFTILAFVAASVAVWQLTELLEA